MIITLGVALLVLVALGYISVQTHKTNQNITNIHEKINDVNNDMKSVAKGVKDMTPSYTIQMNKSATQPFVKLKFKNTDNKLISAWFMIDTGSQVDVLMPSFVKSIQHVKSNSNGTIASVGENRECQIVKSQFKVGGCPILYNNEFSIIDIQEVHDTLQSHYNIDVVGIIGNDFLVKHGWHIDVLTKRLRIYPL